MTLVISDAHHDARSQATIDFADLGTSSSNIALLDINGITLATIILKKPCGVITGGVIALEQAATIGDQITTDGAAVRGVWSNSQGSIVAEGVVTDSAGSGDFKISSAEGTTLYAGGYVLLGATSLS